MRFAWQQGRQGTGYEKLLLLATALLPFDLYILRYKVGASIPWHTDPVAGYKHHRINIFWGKYEGGSCEFKGEFVTPKYLKYFCDHGYYFRSDLIEHQVTEIVDGTRYVLSLGWCTR